ncbi:MAG: response regulator, partial [Puniceicoccales bacterium]
HADKKLRLRVDRDHLETIIETAILGSLECVDVEAKRDGMRALKISWENTPTGVKLLIENPLERVTPNRGQKIAEVSQLMSNSEATRTKMEFLYWAVSNSLLEHYSGAMLATNLEGGGVRTTLAMEMERMEASPSKERPLGGLTLESGKPRESLVALPFRLKVLVVEDDPINRMLISELLKRLGQEYEHAKNGHAALEMLAEHSDYDLIMMDIDMPVLNGVATTQALRMGEAGEKAGAIPIVAVTAFNTLSDESKFRKAGMNYFIAKPIGVQDLRMVLLEVNRKDTATATA